MDNIMINQLYSRQDGLDISSSDESALIIGCGGIGSWIALDLALLGIGTLIIIDPDKIEPSNLNRTLFKLSDIGRFKTHAIKDLISERRPECIVITIEEYFNLDIYRKYTTDYVFDCSDNLKSRELFKDLEACYVKCGYDGFSATLSFNDFSSGQWGEDGSYTVVPSFFGTPQIISAIAIIEMLMVDAEQKATYTFNVKEMLNKLVQEAGK